MRASKFTTGAFIAAAAISASVSARQQTAEVADGKQKYNVYCATCHGPEGKGDGTLSKSVRKKPAESHAAGEEEQRPVSGRHGREVHRRADPRRSASQVGHAGVGRCVLQVANQQQPGGSESPD